MSQTLTNLLRYASLFPALLLIAQVGAEEPQTPAAPAETAAPAADFDALIGGLDAAEFSQRQEASQKLAEQGLPALPALEKGAAGDSREAALRSLELIKKLFESSDAETKKQAGEVLKRLATSDKPAIASRAKAMLEPPTQPQNDPNIQAFQGIPAQGGVIKIQAVVNPQRRVTIRTQNGVREIEVKEGEQQIKISDDPAKSIKVEVTEKKDGKEETKKYEAKNADELKQNHPEAHKLYEKYAKPGNAQIQFGIQGQIGGVPVGGPGMNPADMAKRRLESTEKALESIQKAIDQFEQQKQRLVEEKTKLEKQIADNPPAAAPAPVPEAPKPETPAPDAK